MIGTGLIIAAPSSGSGKTTVTLGLLRALKRRGVAVRGAKSGPDYIDPRFHEAACGQLSYNLDAWAMSVDRIRALSSGPGMLLIEGAMGLFDGAPPDGRGATADLARCLQLPVVLVIDAARMSQSVAPLVAGFAQHDPGVRVAGIILNRVGSPRHAAMLRAALAPLGLPVFGAIPRSEALQTPSRHLGLIQAQEHPELEQFLNTAADVVETHVDLDTLAALAMPMTDAQFLKHLPQHKRTIAIARDAAFAFTYAQDLAAWEQTGATLRFFSPLADDPVPEADVVYLPGGYPELHARTLSQAHTFIESLGSAAQTSDIYGECGGYMTLGETLIDADGTAHRMAGLLGLVTSFERRKLHLGYRRLTGPTPPMAPAQAPRTEVAGHEFHYATTLSAEGTPLWTDTWDAEGTALGPAGLVEGRVSGSFAHVIDVAPPPLAPTKSQA